MNEVPLSLRLAVLATVVVAGVHAQFSGLTSSADGSSLYFASTLYLKGSPRLLNGKIFVATQDGVRLLRAREPLAPPADSPNCSVGGFAEYLGAEASAGVLALAYSANRAGSCTYPANPYMTQIVSAYFETSVPGVARLAADGRYAIVFLAATARQYDGMSVSFLNLDSGTQTPVSYPLPQFPESVQAPPDGGRVIANDGTALLAISDGSGKNRGYLLKPGAAPVPFPVADGLPLFIAADASKALYRRLGGLYLIDLGTLSSTLLIPSDQTAFNPAMSDDARRLLFLRDGQAHVLDTSTLLDRTLTSDAAKLAAAAISGNGKIVHAVTGAGRLIKLDVDTDSQTELVGRTPYLSPVYSSLVPGLAATLSGSGLSDSDLTGTPPLNAWLGNVTMWIGERKVPVAHLAPNSVSIIVPWDLQADGSLVRIQAEAPGDRTPFYYPEVEATVDSGWPPRAGAVLRQDWKQTYVGPISTGEIIHVYAVGFGPVAPEIPEGAAAPSAEPLARTASPLTCSNADVLYAGLAPGAIERVYQIDLRIGPTPGYQKFTCSLGTAAPFLFLTLLIV